MTFYSERDGAGRPVLQIAMPRLPRLYAPGGTMHVVARCNNREFYFAEKVKDVRYRVISFHGTASFQEEIVAHE